jgi:hypothetical protein
LQKALLSFFYPAAQGFSLRPTNFAMMQHGDHGWAIECKRLLTWVPEMHHAPTDCISGFLVEKASVNNDLPAKDVRSCEAKRVQAAMATSQTTSGPRLVPVLVQPPSPTS